MTTAATAAYITSNWGYFGQSWKTVSPAIRHYQNNPGDLENEVVGVNAFKDRKTLQERDVSSARILTAPNPFQFQGELVTRIRHLKAGGFDAEDIQRTIGPVEFDDAEADYLSISGIEQICNTGKPIVSQLVAKVMK